MKKQEIGISLDSIKFIVQHPWFFFYPLIIVMSFLFAHLSYMPIYYECKALISFQSLSANLVGAKFIQNRQEVINNLFLGENIRNIVRQVWPEVPEDSKRFINLVEKLRASRGGIRITGGDISAVYYMDTSPEVCYKVVGSAIDILKKSSKSSTEKQIETGKAFLQKQLDIYRNRIKDIDGEIVRIKIELRKKYPDLSDEEKYLIDEILGSKTNEAKIQTKVQQAVNYDDKITDLNLTLLELKKKRESIMDSLKEGQAAFTDKDLESDTAIMQYDKEISLKELVKADLLSKGYMMEHPQIRQIDLQIENLKSLKEKRFQDLLSKPVSGSAKTAFIGKLKKQLKDIDSQIDMINIKIDTLESYKRSSETGEHKESGSKTNTTASEASKLIDLNAEKNINQNYYNNVKQQLESMEMSENVQKEEAGLNIVVVEEPKLPTEPIPLQKVKQILMWLVFAVSSGTGAAYIVESLNSSIRSSSELRELVRVPVLASIDRINLPREIRMESIRRKALFAGLIVIMLSAKIVYKVVLGRLF